MINLYFEDYEDLACEICDRYEDLKSRDKYDDVAVIAKYEEMRQIIKELMCFGYDLHSIEMHDVEYEDYDSEYILSLYDDEIWVEKMLRETGYITDESVIIYVLDNCSSKVIPHCKGKIVYEVNVDDDDDDDEYCDCDYDCDDDDDECCCCECNECSCKEESRPTTTSKELYTINGRNVSKEEFLKVEKELDKEFRDSLLSWCESTDGMMDKIRKMFLW